MQLTFWNCFSNPCCSDFSLANTAPKALNWIVTSPQPLPLIGSTSLMHCRRDQVSSSLQPLAPGLHPFTDFLVISSPPPDFSHFITPPEPIFTLGLPGPSPFFPI